MVPGGDYVGFYPVVVCCRPLRRKVGHLFRLRFFKDETIDVCVCRTSAVRQSVQRQPTTEAVRTRVTKGGLEMTKYDTRVTGI